MMFPPTFSSHERPQPRPVYDIPAVIVRSRRWSTARGLLVRVVSSVAASRRTERAECSCSSSSAWGA